MSNLLDKKAFIFDLDGCLYRGCEPIEGASSVVAALRSRGKKILFLTNNSTKTPAAYVDKLRSMGIGVSLEEVLTSSVATANYIKRFGLGNCYAIGEEGLMTALKDEGFGILGEEDAACAKYMVCGLDTHVDYQKLSAACLAIQGGAKFFATNNDPSLPIEGGYLPGAGAIVSAIATATKAKPIIIGKPSSKVMRAALKKLGTKKDETAIIGDTLNMDVKAGKGAGIFTVLVLTGSTSMQDLKHSKLKPDMVLASVADILKI